MWVSLGEAFDYCFTNGIHLPSPKELHSVFSTYEVVLASKLLCVKLVDFFYFRYTAGCFYSITPQHNKLLLLPFSIHASKAFFYRSIRMKICWCVLWVLQYRPQSADGTGGEQAINNSSDCTPFTFPLYHSFYCPQQVLSPSPQHVDTNVISLRSFLSLWIPMVGSRLSCRTALQTFAGSSDYVELTWIRLQETGRVRPDLKGCLLSWYISSQLLWDMLTCSTGLVEKHINIIQFMYPWILIFSSSDRPWAGLTQR